MGKVFLGIWLLLFCQIGVGEATEFVETLTRTFKTRQHPPNDLVVKITVNTQLTHLSGNNRNKEVLQAYDVHQKLVHTFKQNGWVDNPLGIADLDVGKIDVELGEGMSLKMKKTLRMKIFVYQCEHPMRKYRGGDVRQFFLKVLKDAEKCFVFDEKLQGRSYPY